MRPLRSGLRIADGGSSFLLLLLLFLLHLGIPLLLLLLLRMLLLLLQRACTHTLACQQCDVFNDLSEIGRQQACLVTDILFGAATHVSQSTCAHVKRPK